MSVSSGTNVYKWTPKIFAQGMNVYTWTPQKSACPSAILETGKRYIVFAEYDSSERFVLADSCRSIVDATTPDGIELAKKLENLKF